MQGSITKYTVKGSSRPRWRYRLVIGKDAAGKYVYEGKAGFEKQGDAADVMRIHIEELKQRGDAAVSVSTMAALGQPSGNSHSSSQSA